MAYRTFVDIRYVPFFAFFALASPKAKSWNRS